MIPSNYIDTLKELKNKISESRLKVGFAVNAELLRLYWEIGKTILEEQNLSGWGAKVIESLSSDLRTEFPDFKGLSVRNLKYMRSFAKSYPEFSKVQQGAALFKIPSNQSFTFVQQLAAQIPWGHHQVIMDKVKTSKERLFYIERCVENGWSRNILKEQIVSQLYLRQGKAITNFKETLPSMQSDLAQETLKNPYVFDFLSYGQAIKERDLENGLIQHLKSFMLELGKGFSYVGNQKNLLVEGDDFFLDLLFYNYQLHCFVVVELKIGDFKAEYAGKLNFYVNTVNEQLKTPLDKPTIGVLLCRTPNETVVKYSLQGIDSPIGVADYELASALPDKLKAEIPTVEEFEKEIEKEYAELKSSKEKKIDTIREMLVQIKEPKIKEEFSTKVSHRVFDEILRPLRHKIEGNTKYISAMFKEFKLYTGISNKQYNNEQDAITELKEYPNQNRYGLIVRASGFLEAGLNSFGVYMSLNLILDQYKYTVKHSNGDVIYENLYHLMPNEDELNKISDRLEEMILDDIKTSLSNIITK
ncbi:MAG: hypothetical protein COA58_03030 [Bacteroidetes bacterium]|nr:MAG: hypothetical protein COA58_03030 [Bacteroidota bacterium]